MTWGNDIPCTYRSVPYLGSPADGLTIGGATMAELKAAGFHGDSESSQDTPGQQPLDEMLIEGVQEITPDVADQILRNVMTHVLFDRDGTIVATWDEGRWWTPSESDAFMAMLVEEMRRLAREGGAT